MRKRNIQLKKIFSMLALLIIPVGVAVNFVGGQLASILKLQCILTRSEQFLLLYALRSMGWNGDRSLTIFVTGTPQISKLCVYSS